VLVPVRQSVALGARRWRRAALASRAPLATDRQARLARPIAQYSSMARRVVSLLRAIVHERHCFSHAWGLCVNGLYCP
ncbi:hypothetical protein PENSPDRAFT_646394, partial [Peniophora sp. CONT]